MPLFSCGQSTVHLTVHCRIVFLLLDTGQDCPICLLKVKQERMIFSSNLKQGDALSPLLFNSALEYAIRWIRVNQDSLKTNGTHQLLFYADISILGGSIHAMKKNIEALVVAGKEIGLEVNVDKTKYMSMSEDQSAGRSHCVKIDNGLFERVDEFKYLGTTLTYGN